MSNQFWVETIAADGGVDGPTLTAAAAASCIPTNAKITLPNNFWYIGRKLRITMFGRISCVVTTPGTARLDVRLGSVVAFDTGAQALNTTAKTTVPWFWQLILSCRAVGNGTLSNLIGMSTFVSEALLGSPAASTGNINNLILPIGTPAVGTGFDNTAANTLDVFFTQTVATGSFTVHHYMAESMN